MVTARKTSMAGSDSDASSQDYGPALFAPRTTESAKARSAEARRLRNDPAPGTAHHHDPHLRIMLRKSPQGKQQQHRSTAHTIDMGKSERPLSERATYNPLTEEEIAAIETKDEPTRYAAKLAAEAKAAAEADARRLRAEYHARQKARLLGGGADRARACRALAALEAEKRSRRSEARDRARRDMRHAGNRKNMALPKGTDVAEERAKRTRAFEEKQDALRKLLASSMSPDDAIGTLEALRKKCFERV